MVGDAKLNIPDAERDHIQGPIEAPITLLEYGDYECPYCSRTQRIFKAIQQRLGNNLCFAYRHFPIVDVHPHAEHAAEAAEAASSQGKFWEMHEMLLRNQHALNDKDLAACAAALGLDETKLIGEVTLEIYAMRVRDDFKLGVAAGVNRTPCLFINGSRYDGVFRLEPILTAVTQKKDRVAGVAKPTARSARRGKG
jgi:protein-disulfide isomerase